MSRIIPSTLQRIQPPGSVLESRGGLILASAKARMFTQLTDAAFHDSRTAEPSIYFRIFGDDRIHIPKVRPGR
jgi:hypothetical protein